MRLTTGAPGLRIEGAIASADPDGGGSAWWCPVDLVHGWQLICVYLGCSASADCNVQWVFHTGETKDYKVESRSHRFLGVMVGFGVLAVEPT